MEGDVGIAISRGLRRVGSLVGTLTAGGTALSRQLLPCLVSFGQPMTMHLKLLGSDVSMRGGKRTTTNPSDRDLRYYREWHLGFMPHDDYQ